MNWDVMCRNKRNGGLGIKRLIHMNDAFIMKIGWKIKVNPDNICSQVRMGKYDRGNDLRREISVSNGDSCLLKEIARLWDVLNINQRWCVGDGREASFWLDNWGVDEFPLINYLNSSIPMCDVS